MRESPDSSGTSSGWQTCAEAAVADLWETYLLNHKRKRPSKLSPDVRWHMWDNSCCPLFQFANVFGMTELRVGVKSLFKEPHEPSVASGVTISNPVCSYLGFFHGLSKTFENKQVRKFSKTILAIHSDIWWDNRPKLVLVYHFSGLAFWDSFPC